MSVTELELDLDELESAEDFLEYFDVPFDQSVVHVNRLHILQRYHDYLDQHGVIEGSEDQQRAVYRELLVRAYDDFVQSDALTEKVFKVFHMHEPQQAFVSVNDLLGETKSAPTV